MFGVTEPVRSWIGTMRPVWSGSLSPSSWRTSNSGAVSCRPRLPQYSVRPKSTTRCFGLSTSFRNF